MASHEDGVGTFLPVRGWYADPWVREGRRWWDGAEWTQTTMLPGKLGQQSPGAARDRSIRTPVRTYRELGRWMTVFGFTCVLASAALFLTRDDSTFTASTLGVVSSAGFARPDLSESFVPKNPDDCTASGRFSLPSGKYQTDIKVLSHDLSCPWTELQSVNIRYDPADPRHSEIDTGLNGAELFQWLFVIPGFVMLTLGLFAPHAVSSRPRKVERSA